MVRYLVVLEKKPYGLSWKKEENGHNHDQKDDETGTEGQSLLTFFAPRQWKRRSKGRDETGSHFRRMQNTRKTKQNKNTLFFYFALATSSPHFCQTSPRWTERTQNKAGKKSFLFLLFPYGFLEMCNRERCWGHEWREVGVE